MRVNERLMALGILLSRASSLFPQKERLHHARFAYPHELTSLIRPGPEDSHPSLLLGSLAFNHVLRVSPSRNRRELGNMLVVAPPRAGKSILATSQLLTWPHSVIVNDIKGELFAQTAGYRSTLGRVYVIDPTGVGHRFDPSAGKRTDLELKSIAKSLLFRPNEGEG